MTARWRPVLDSIAAGAIGSAAGLAFVQLLGEFVPLLNLTWGHAAIVLLANTTALTWKASRRMAAGRDGLPRARTVLR